VEQTSADRVCRRKLFEQEVTMKRIAIAAAMVAATALASMGGAQAAGVEFNVGPGGVYVGNGHHYGWRHRHYRESYGFGGCRVVVRTHYNRFGERVTVRRRVCD
jgi:hypothetical protein